ncbi:MAG: CHASE2 domain-containing protein [Bacteroidetes bacterium]|nr:CHASE2 domain-containing protein [Bacteroidota bacterium]
MLKFWFRCVYVTVFVFFMMWFVSKLTDFKLFSAFDPVSQALAEFDLTDYAFSNLRPLPTVDERIVLVNFGHIPRGDIAQQIAIINKYKPKVIGIDSYFNCEGGLYDTINCPQLLDTLSNLFLSDAIKEAGNVVLVSKLLQKTATANNTNLIDVYDSLEYSDPMFDNYSGHAFANLITEANYQEDVKLCRSFIPRMKINGKYENAFAVELARRFDSTKTNKLFARGNEEELVNYRGNVELTDIRLKTLQNKNLETTNFRLMFYALDIDQLMSENFAPELFKDKIVLVGFLGDYFGDPAWEDKYFTPLNKKVAGRANPDMFGVVVHANIIAMILNEDYVGELPEWSKWALAAVLGVLTVALFSVIDEKLPIWYDALSVLIQVIQILLISGFVVYAFAEYTIKLDLSYSIAVSALVGPCYDFLKPVQSLLEKRLTKRRERRLSRKKAQQTNAHNP